MQYFAGIPGSWRTKSAREENAGGETRRDTSELASVRICPHTMDEFLAIGMPFLRLRLGAIAGL
jgi:hypothetical protein